MDLNALYLNHRILFRSVSYLLLIVGLTVFSMGIYVQHFSPIPVSIHSNNVFDNLGLRVIEERDGKIWTIPYVQSELYRRGMRYGRFVAVGNFSHKNGESAKEFSNRVELSPDEEIEVTIDFKGTIFSYKILYGLEQSFSSRHGIDGVYFSGLLHLIIAISVFFIFLNVWKDYLVANLIANSSALGLAFSVYSTIANVYYDLSALLWPLSYLRMSTFF